MLCHEPPFLVKNHVITDILFISLQVKGLPEALATPNSFVASNYSPETVTKTHEYLQAFQGGQRPLYVPHHAHQVSGSSAENNVHC